jgi:hypothetical protein
MDKLVQQALEQADQDEVKTPHEDRELVPA